RALGIAAPAAPGKLPVDPGRARPDPPGTGTPGGDGGGDRPPVARLRRDPAGRARNPDGTDRPLVRPLSPGDPRPPAVVEQGGGAAERRREDRARQADGR